MDSEVFGYKSESVEHMAAKEAVSFAFQEWIEGRGNKPFIHRKCKICWDFREEKNFFSKIDAIEKEYRITSGHRVDIALLNKEQLQAAIEIKITSPVNETKAVKILCPFIELDGMEVLRGSETWTSINDNLPELICEKCEEAVLKFKKKLQQVSQKTGVALTGGTYYRCAVQKCWKCDEEIIVFTWPNDGLWEAASPVEEPLPQTVKFIEKMGYWGNVCPFCNSLQGDFFLKMEEEGAFFRVDCKDDSVESFQDDLLNMAHIADLNGILND
jgi:hypothetical protein